MTVLNCERASAFEEFVMNRSIVAIPLLAAIWFAAPARASAQDPQPEPRVAQPRTAVPRAERPVRDTEPRVVKAPVAATAPTPTAAEADDQRGELSESRGARSTADPSLPIEYPYRVRNPDGPRRGPSD